MTAIGHSTNVSQPRRAPLEIDIGNDFSKYPGGRYKRLGPYSGEELRPVLAEKLRVAISEGGRLRVILDGVRRSYQPSFLDEAFAGLIRDEGFSKDDVQKHLVLVSTVPRFAKYRALAESYIESAE